MAKWSLRKNKSEPVPEKEIDYEAKPDPTFAFRMDQVNSLFRYTHLPVHLQTHSKPFYDMAVHLVDTLPPSAECTLALRKIWEAKNLAVFAAVEGGDS